MSNPIIPYYRKHISLIRENIRISEDPENIEAIHDLRLSIKRLRVVVQLSGMLSGADAGDLPGFKAINKFFKRSGKLRDIQVIQQLLYEYDHPSLNPLLEKLDKKAKRQRHKYENALASFNINSLEKLSQGLDQLLENTDAYKVKAEALIMLTDLLMEIEEIFHQTKKEKRYHSIRRRLKDIQYLNNIFEDGLPIEETLSIPSLALKDLGTLAGNWHDHLNMQKHVSRFMRKFPEQSSDNLGVLRDQIIDRKNDLQQEYACILINEMKV